MATAMVQKKRPPFLRGYFSQLFAEQRTERTSALCWASRLLSFGKNLRVALQHQCTSLASQNCNRVHDKLHHNITQDAKTAKSRCDKTLVSSITCTPLSTASAPIYDLNNQKSKLRATPYPLHQTPPQPLHHQPQHPPIEKPPLLIPDLQPHPIMQTLSEPLPSIRLTRK